jgi:hypothetical protein
MRELAGTRSELEDLGNVLLEPSFPSREAFGSWGLTIFAVGEPPGERQASLSPWNRRQIRSA